MKHLFLLLLGLTLTCYSVNAQQKEEANMSWKSFEIEDLKDQLTSSQKPWLPFLKVESLSCGLYSLAKGSEDKQSPHSQDEVYYVLEGKASFVVGEEKSTAKKGSVIYVKAGEPHRFYDITEDLQVLVFFSAKTGD